MLCRRRPVHFPVVTVALEIIPDITQEYEKIGKGSADRDQYEKCLPLLEATLPLEVSVHCPGFEIGPEAGFFPAGLETPMLISRKPTPFRSSTNNFTAEFLPHGRQWFKSAPPHHFFTGGSVMIGVASEVSPFRMATAAGGSGLSALARRTLTCHISESVRDSLYEGMPLRRMPFTTFQ